MMTRTREETSVVLIDDDEFQLKLLRHHVSGNGIKKIVTSTNGLEAIDQINNRGLYDALLILDLNMPIMDGVTFLNLLKDTRFEGGLILVSGEDERIIDSTKKIASSYGINVIGHLVKPVSRESLDSYIDNYLLGPKAKKKTSNVLEYSADRLEHAIHAGEIITLYQPKVDVQTGKPVGMEALARWNHPDDGLVLPEYFIQLAEDSGHIAKIFHLMLANSLSDLRVIKNEGLDINVSVNISMNNLTSIDLISTIKNELEMSGISPRELILEVTETSLLQEYSLVLGILTSLRLHHINLAIDDFGTGHSSIAQLRDIPFNELKLDKSFVHDACVNSTLRGIFNASMQMARNLNIKTVAEGVENIEDWHFVRSSDCELAQGTFISDPIAAHEIREWSFAWNQRHNAFIYQAIK